MTRTKRKYNRLTPSNWAEICALWEIGDVTLPDLADRYSVNTRTLQAHFAKHKVEKGSKAAAVAISVKKKIFASGLGDKDLTIQRARETREAAYKNASAVEGLIMGTIEAMQNDPAKTLGLTSKLKALSLAAAGLERIHGLKFRALGLDKDLPIHDEFPVLTFRDLTPLELEGLHARNEDDDLGCSLTPLSSAVTESENSDSDESEEIVEEGEKREDKTEKIRSASIAAVGGRLVKA